MEVDTQAIAELVPIAFLITVANGLVLVLFAQRKHLRTAPNYILLSLAICDISSGIINIPLFILVAFTSVLRSTQSHSYFVILVSVLNNMSAVSTCYHILVATSEKYLSIVFPVKHRRITTKTIATVLGVVWTWSIIVSFAPFAWTHVQNTDAQFKSDLAHVIFCLITVFMLPYMFMIYTFVVMFKRISKLGENSKSKIATKPQMCRQAWLEKKCFVLFVSMATIYLVSWLPWYILMLLYKIWSETERLQIPSHVFVLVRYATSITNPGLFTFFRRDFKLALRSVLRKCCQKAVVFLGQKKFVVKRNCVKEERRAPSESGVGKSFPMQLSCNQN